MMLTPYTRAACGLGCGMGEEPPPPPPPPPPVPPPPHHHGGHGGGGGWIQSAFAHPVYDVVLERDTATDAAGTTCLPNTVLYLLAGLAALILLNKGRD